MRILFYLPVVTPWWFDAIVAPLIRAATRGGEVHVLVPPLWQGTGIGGEQLAACADLDQVHWHILDGDDHPTLRDTAQPRADIIALVREIDPDLSLCRSAELATPAQFPGVVRYIMEGGAPPFATDPRAVYLAHTLFDHGILPELAAADRLWLEQALAPAWTALHGNLARMARAEFLAEAGLPDDRRLIGLPLDYEHEEVFFNRHNPYGSNIDLIDRLAAELDEDCVLAVTNHPLNERLSDTRPLRRAIRNHGGKVRLLGQIGAPGAATMLLARHGDGMVVGNSKSFAGCAFFGTPMLRLTRFATGDWMGAYADYGSFIAAIRTGNIKAAQPEDARTWFAFHLANNVFDPTDRTLNGAALVDRARRNVDPERWAAGLAPYRAVPKRASIAA